LVLVLVVVALGALNYVRPVPVLTPRTLQAASVTMGQAPTFAWPGGTEDAIGVAGLGVLAQTPGQAPEPTGSVAKVMTALVALQKLPLTPGQQGPSITITAADQALQEQDAAAGESTVPVTAGETLTEYQVLQGMLVPSGNNLAVLLAGWAFGSTGAALTAMQAEGQTLGLQGSDFTDPSGFDPTTVSTPADLVRLGAAAIQNPVIAGIVAESEVTLPVAGTVKNVNSVLGQAGIVGIKTGNTAGQEGAFLYAAQDASAKGAMVVGAVMGEGSLGQALQDAVALAGNAQQALAVRTIVGAGTVVAGAEAPWNQDIPISTENALSVVAWGGQQARISIRLRPLTAPVPQGTKVGTLTATLGEGTFTTPLVTSAALRVPPWNWRLLRRPQYVPARDWPFETPS
jgi:D-alanyl-D-alanine carboxypeptidase (penicillin-binding protein 5/6)